MNINFLILGCTANSIILKKRLFKIDKERIFYNTNIKYLENEKYIIIKHFNKNLIEIIKKLKKKNNTIIYEPIDLNWKFKSFNEYINEMEIFKYVDKIIFPSKHSIEILKNYINSNKLFYNYHEFDNRFKINYNKKENNIYYIGDICKSSFNLNIFNKYNIIHIKSSNNDNILETTYNVSIHIDYLKKNNIYYDLHTSTKLSTAMNFKSIFISNRIPIYEEILGNDYELFFKDDLSDLELIIKKATLIINNNNLYINYINKMKPILDRLSPKLILNNYNKIIN